MSVCFNVCCCCCLVTVALLCVGSEGETINNNNKSYLNTSYNLPFAVTDDWFGEDGNFLF